jgi:hypothetical protein
MTLDQVQLYSQRYQGSKVAFNSRRGVGKIIQGIATDMDRSLNVVILRDDDNFPHCVYLLTLEEI